MALRISAVAIAAACLGISGCANWNAVKKDFSTKQGAAISIDAKQRAIYSVEVDPGDNRRNVVCAEPSPDALASLAASLGLDGAGAVKSFGLAFSSQEAAASIGLRTQTIQTLRDAMYRLCEGYAGGALDDVGFVRLQRRYQAVMLGLLAIEQLTGATVANQAMLGGNSGARLGNSLGKVSALVTEARQNLVAAQADLVARKAVVATKTKEVADAEAALKKATEDAKGSETQQLKDARDAHKARSEELAKSETARAKAQQAEAVATGELESLEQLRKELDRASAVAVAGAQLSGVANVATGPTDAAGITRVADAVEKIVTTIVSHDYTREACLDWMLSRNVQDAFNFGRERALSLVQLQYEMCAKEREYAHAVEVARVQAAAAAAQRAPTPAPAAAVAAVPGSVIIIEPKPSQKPVPKPAPVPKPSPRPASSPKPGPPPTPAPSASAPVPAVSVPAPAASIPALPSPGKAAAEVDKRIESIIEKAKNEAPLQRMPPRQDR